MFFIFVILVQIPSIIWADTCPAGYQPAEYEVLEYIESTGTQYIDTEIIPSTNNYIINTTITPLIADVNVLVGVANSSKGYPGILINGTGIFRYGNQNFQHISPSFVQNTKYALTLSEKKLVVNGIVYTTTDPSYEGNIEYSIYLFARNNGIDGVGNQATMRLYSYSISNGAQIIQNLIPVKRASDNVIGMYDTVTNTFFTNAGTGTFIAGPETYESIYGNGSGCKVCPPNTYKDISGNVPCTSCPSTTFSKTGATSINDCGHVMHVGDKIYFLGSQKLTTPALHVRMPDGTIYYGSLYQQIE